MTGRCGTCRHWGPELENETHGVRQCRRIPEWWEARQWNQETLEDELIPEFRDVLAFANDGSAYRAELLTKAAFGCVMHEPAP